MLGKNAAECWRGNWLAKCSGVAASIIPARRAAALDPIAVLRYEYPMVLRTTTNQENNLEKEVSWSDRLVDEGRAILARLEPEYEYDLDVDGHNELLPRS